VISPGSRNAPLTLGFTDHPFFHCYSIVDERCASHVALGMAQQLRKPVVLLCTSGSALLNYYPAVAEAYYSEIPLIVLSADRPPHKIDIGDGQTIRQNTIFQDHIIYENVLRMVNGVKDSENIATNERLINRAIDDSINLNGPVHLNVPFEEPLYNRVEKPSIDIKSMESIMTSTSEIPAQFMERWVSAKKKLVILSTLNPDVFDSKDVEVLIQDPSVLVMSEVSSNVVNDQFIWGIDTLIAPIEKDSETIKFLQPDLVLTIGGMIVSKKIKLYLRTFQTTYHYHIGNRRAYDTFFKLSGHLKMRPSDAVKRLGDSKVKSDYQQHWQEVFKDRLGKREKYLDKIPWCDFKVFDLIFKDLPKDIILQLGNSSTIRYAQLFQMHPSWKVFANRGTSGIEGCTSTAAGAAMASDRQTILITGDISFFYDANGLWNKYLPSNFRIILIDNSGGGIFRILPSNKEEENFHTFFETRHDLTAVQLCKMHGIGYHSAVDEYAFAKAYKEFLKTSDRPQLLEVFTPTELNDRILLDYFKFIK
jgi:2-succinyl-5-enolpyruvyl-6-hydroxy-3-cyclohexene-1-carboxylate synthase